MKGEFAKLEAQIAALNAQMAAMVGPKGTLNAAGWQRANKTVQDFSSHMRAAANSSGMFEASQMRVASATDNYIKKLERQRVTFRDMMADGRKQYRATYREQLRMQQMTIKELPGRDRAGRKMYDLYIPNEVHKDWDTLNKRVGFFRENLKSASIQLQNWGKNTQWAGRQLMVGFTMPLLAFGAATGVLAYQIDKQMTRIAKVYDTTANANSKNLKDQLMLEQEYAQLREDSWRTAEEATRQYGVAAHDTLSIQAELAAQGLTGMELQRRTNEIMRIATLGEMEHADALNASNALMSVFRLNTEETADAFNYMNAVENATSLQLADFAKAIPIAAAPVKAFGGDVKELGILLTAMRENGIQATEGANALKAAMQRLGRPSKQIQEEFKAITGGDIVQLVDGSDSLTEVFMKLNEITSNLGRNEKRDVFAGLFGSYQVARMMALVDGMDKLAEGTGQVSAAARVAEMDTKQWADSAEREITKMRESGSKQFEIALNTVRNQLSEMGGPFLEMAATVLKTVSWIIEAFRGLPDFVKTGAKWTAIFLAIAGPAAMLVGLTANLAGMMGRLGVSILGLVTNFNIYNRETAAGRLATQLMERGFLSAGTAASIMAADLRVLTQAAIEAKNATAGVGATPLIGTLGVPGTTGRYAKGSRDAAGTALGGRVTQIVPPGATMLPLVASTPKAGTIAEDTSKHSKAMRGMAVSAGVVAAAMTASAVSSNEMVDNLAMAAMIAASLGPLMMAALPAMKALPGTIATGFATAGTKIKGATAGAAKFGSALKQAPGAMGKLSMLSTSAGAAIAGMVSPLGLVIAGLAAAAGGAYLLYKNSEKAANEIKAMNNAEGMGEIFDYTPIETAERDTSKERERFNLVSQINEKYSGIVDRVRQANDDQQRLNEALRAGLLVIQSGGTAQQARQATLAAIQAAHGEVARNRIALQFKYELDFTREQVVKDVTEMIGNIDFTNALASADNKSIGEALNEELWHMGNPDDTITKEARALLDNVGKQAREILMISMERGNGSRGLVDMVSSQLNEIDKIVAQRRKRGDSEGVNRMLDFRQEYIRDVVKGVGGDVSMMNDEWFETADAINVINNTLAELTTQQRIAFLQSKANAGTITKEQQKRLDSLLKAQGANKILNNIMAGGAIEAEKIPIGIRAVEPAADGAANAVDGLTAAERRATREAGALAAAAKRVKDAYQSADWAGAMRGAMENVQGTLADAARSDFDNRMSSAMDSYRAEQQARLDSQSAAQDRAADAMDNRHERQTEAFENRWERRKEAVEKAYDGRIERINKTIKAETALEDQRKRIFEAERARIQRMNEMANMTVDFNLALDTGQLDEAAKIRNDMVASEENWTLEDTDKALERKHEKRMDNMQEEIDKIEELKKKRLEALAEEEERQRKHLDKMHENQQRALDKRQEAAQKNLQQEVDNNIAAQEAIWENRKENVDKAIRLFLSYVPKNEADLRRHIARISEKYGIFNTTQENKFGNTAKNIGKMLRDETMIAAQAIRSDIRWAEIGNHVAREMMWGALGMKPGEFKNWMTSGVWPEGAGTPSGKDLKNRANAPSGAHEKKLYGDSYSNHTGGWAGENKVSTGRKGVARTSPLMPDEYKTILRRGEFVVNKDAAQHHAGLLEAVNSGKGVGGIGSGFAGMFGGIMRAMMGSTIRQGIQTGYDNKKAQQEAASYAGMFGSAAAGQYGDVAFTAEQLKNAMTIANVGQSMGMSKRDIQIGIMTAITESMLRNVRYGDRDSQGLFQQRPSQGWGSVEQVTDPQYAAKKFYSVLKGIENRGDMSPWMAAQAVQRSAYADGSNYRQYWDEAQAIMGALGKGSGAGIAGGKLQMGPGGRFRPVSYPISRGLHDTDTAFPGVDLSAPTGVPVRAVAGGVVTASYDIPGYEPRAPHGGLGYRSYGRVITIDHGGFATLYAHLSERFARQGQTVPGGTVIGKVGNTGYSTGSHLHFGARGISPYALASLSKGASNINVEGLYNLHKNEAVLTEDLNTKFKQGVENFASGGNSEYNINVNVTNPNANADDIAKSVLRTIQWNENRKPKGRRG